MADQPSTRPDAARDGRVSVSETKCHCETSLNDLYEFCTEDWEPQSSHTHRGFAITEFRDTYGQACSIQESSSVIPRVWVGVGGCRMHLNPEQARGLAVMLLAFADDSQEGGERE